MTPCFPARISSTTEICAPAGASESKRRDRASRRPIRTRRTRRDDWMHHRCVRVIEHLQATIGKSNHPLTFPMRTDSLTVKALAFGVTMSTSFILNGKPTTLDADPNMPLLWAVREVAGLPGTKFGCGMALCGACTVHLDGQAVRSCVLPLSAVAGREITTIEGLKSRQAKAVQAAWVELQVPQCGYCQSGPSMSATA